MGSSIMKWIFVAFSAGICLTLGSFFVLALQVGLAPALAVLGLAIAILAVLVYSLYVRDRAILEYQVRREIPSDVSTLLAKGFGDGKKEEDTHGTLESR